MGPALQEFLQTILSFPTVLFTVPMGVVLIYWAFVAVGALDLDHGIDGGAEGAHEGLSGLMHALRFGDAPLTVVGSLLSFWGWVLSFFCVTLGASLPLPALATQLLSLVVALVGGVGLTSLSLRPLAPLFTHVPTPGGAALVGQTGVVKSGVVNDEVGQVELNDGGAGLLLNARCDASAHTLRKGDQALVVDYDDATGLYAVEPMVALLPEDLGTLTKVPQGHPAKANASQDTPSAKRERGAPAPTAPSKEPSS